MGSKMAAASRVVQVVKPHVPNIREALKAMIYPFTAPPVTAHQATSENPPGAANPASSVKSMSPLTLVNTEITPQKYRRKAVSAEERWTIKERQTKPIISQEEIKFYQRGMVNQSEKIEFNTFH
ncbi:hypothetical protein GDO81_002710 [Engystomops pustulosus]|uniref:Mitochondrial ribosomal protein S36 n=1 Tax=Engystomops pustulosus TaxID=76066 RepID=A0AAV7DQ95_ENGPU|nr:hypothetical protein GDO81_002710 [Engystomops pustulosus]